MSISIFDPRTLSVIVEQLPKTSTFFKDTFFGTESLEITEKVDVDFYKGVRSVAPFKNPALPSTNVEKIGYETKTYTPPTIDQLDTTTVQDLELRAFGEVISNSGMTAGDRAVKMLERVFARFDQMIARREELMCVQIMTTGVIEIKGQGVDEEVDLGLTNTETLSTASKTAWDYVSSDYKGDPIADIRRWSIECQKNGYRLPNVCIMSADAWSAFSAHPLVLADKALWTNSALMLTPKLQSEAVRYVGTLKEFGIELYVHNDYYKDSNGVEQTMLPTGTVILASTNMLATMFYGGITIANGDTKTLETYAASRVSDSWVQENPAARFLRTQSRPLPIAHEVNSWFCATVFGT